MQLRAPVANVRSTGDTKSLLCCICIALATVKKGLLHRAVLSVSQMPGCSLLSCLMLNYEQSASLCVQKTGDEMQIH